MDDLCEVLAGLPQELLNKLEGMYYLKHVYYRLLVMLVVAERSCLSHAALAASMRYAWHKALCGTMIMTGDQRLRTFQQLKSHKIRWCVEFLFIYLVSTYSKVNLL